jgi:hypothetical protein
MNTTVEKPQLLLKHHLKQLKLPTFLAEYERQVSTGTEVSSKVGI